MAAALYPASFRMFVEKVFGFRMPHPTVGVSMRHQVFISWMQSQHLELNCWLISLNRR